MDKNEGSQLAQSVSPLQMAISMCSGEVNTLHKRMEELSQRLAPVLACEKLKTTGVPTNPPSSVQAIQQIDVETDKVRLVIAMIEDVLARLAT